MVNNLGSLAIPDAEAVRFLPEDADFIWSWMDDDSRTDCESVDGLRRAVARSTDAWILYSSGWKPEVAVGVMAPDLLSNEGFLWLVCCRGTGIRFARLVKPWMRELGKRYPRLWGHVDPTRPRAWRLVQWVGATLGEEIEVRGRMERKFRLEID